MFNYKCLRSFNKITIVLFLLLMFNNIFIYNSSAIVGPHWEYDLICTNMSSIKLFVDKTPYESLLNTGDNSILYKEIHGVVIDYQDYCIISNNGRSVITNISVFTDENLSSKSLLLNKSFLDVNETLFLNLSQSEFFFLVSDQGVVAKIYLVDPKSEVGYFFKLNSFSITLIIFATISFISGLFFIFYYPKKKRKIYLMLAVMFITLSIIFYIFSYLMGISYIMA